MWSVNYVLSQILVVAFFGLYALTFLLKTKKSVLIVLLCGGVLNTISFILLGAYTGAVVNIVAMIRSVWFFFDEKNGKRTWISLTVVMLLVICATIFTYKKWIDILPFVAGIGYTFACWQKNIPLYRWLGIFVNILYLLYNILIYSIFGVIGELVATVCALIGIISGEIKKKHVQATSELNAK